MTAAAGSIELPPDFDDHILALEGINLMLNNGFKESSVLFGKFKSSSPLMSAGASFVSLLQGLMTFEDEKLEKAVESLKCTQKLCNSIEEDFMNNFKNKFRKKIPPKKTVSVEEVLQRKIIVADCYLYIAVVYFIKQEITGYIKGGWSLRKAWKIYEKCYQQITSLLKSRNIQYSKPSSEVGFTQTSETNGDTPKEGLTTSSSASSLTSSDSDEDPLSFGSSNYLNNSGEELSPNILQSNSNSVESSTLLRLYGAVCFGYGAFNLCVSLVPPSLLRIVNMMGFCGDRITGIECLEVASQSEDMKAPLAMLALMWYHTVARPFFAVDGDCMDAGLPEAEKLLKANENKYPKSSLVLFFKGRVLRGKCDIEGALEALQSSYNESVEQRELQLLCSYEIGWCCIMDLQWERALENISRLKEESKWSVCYYAYLTALLQGAMKNLTTCHKIMREVPKLYKRKDNQLETYVFRKAKLFHKVAPTHERIMVLILEVLYLWTAFPDCTQESLQKMLEICVEVSNPSLNGVKQLLLGALYKCLKNEKLSTECFKQALQVSEKDKEDSLIAPFACYELSMTMLASPSTKNKGSELLRHCKENFSGYDFENRLQMRIHATEQRIKSESLKS